jgi:hypothetical protein
MAVALSEPLCLGLISGASIRLGHPADMLSVVVAEQCIWGLVPSGEDNRYTALPTAGDEVVERLRVIALGPG